ncbi:MAG: hypothetical protein ACYC6T_02110 [Thermoleophilia bacterium]
MNTDLRGTTKWALRAAAGAGLLLSLPTLPIAWAVVTGHAKTAFSYAAFLPYQLTWHSLAGTGVGILLTGALCALLLVSGGWPARVLAVVAVVWTVYQEVGFSKGGYWHTWIGVRADPTPSSVAIAITGVLLIAVSVVALVVASRLSVPTAGRLGGPANKPLQTDTAPRRG